MDYWDRLGWPDPFGDAAHTKRQRRYGKLREQKNIWTPQFVVGNEVLPNRQAGTIPKLATEGANAEAQVALELTAEVEEGEVRAKLRVHPTADWTAPEDVKLSAVLVQKHAETEVPKGENAGKTITEYRVARKLVTDLDLTAARSEEGLSVTFELPKGQKADNLGVAVLLEDDADLRTLQCEYADATVAEGPPGTSPGRYPDEGSHPGADDEPGDPPR